MLRPPSMTMKSHTFPIPTRAAVLICGFVLALSSCRKPKTVDTEQQLAPAVIAPELKSNRLAALPGAVYKSQASSPIHWQPWTKATMDSARDARRLVFCVIVMPQQPFFQATLDALTSDASIVADINSSYVPVLVDGDAAREVGLVTADLCSEIKRPLNLPLFVWMTHEGNPVAWIPVSRSDKEGVISLFTQSHTMIAQTWQDSWAYVLKNSGLDNANRRNRLEQRKVSRLESHQPASDVVRSLRQLASLYDPFSRSFDETGGLFPSSSIELLSAASVHPGLPEDVRISCSDTVRELLKDLLSSAMFDPLDGGVFLSRRGTTWSLPSFIRDCPGQARAAVALLEAYRSNRDPMVLEKALGVISFVEKNYATPEGLFSVGLSADSAAEKWMWTVEEVEKLLPAEDAAWWIKYTGMKGLGNLPSEVDPRRNFFRSNTIGLVKPIASIAADLDVPIETFKPRYDAAIAKLLETRQAGIGTQTRDDFSHAGASLRMVSAYAAAFCATGEESYRKKSVDLLTKFRAAFGVGPHLRMYSQDAPESVSAGRAFLYALALQSALDVAAITSDEQWLIWSEDLATTAAEMFTGNGFLKECPDNAKIMDIPVTDLVMLFDDSTAGLVSATESRLAEIGRPMVKSFSELAIPMPTYILERPVLHTDLLLATIARHYKAVAIYGDKLSPEMKLAMERLPMRMVPRRPAQPGDNVPSGSVKILLNGKDAQLVSNPETLHQAALPNPEK